MLRVVTDPQPEPDEHREETTGEEGLLDLLGSVRSLAWIVGPAAPRTVVHDTAEVHVAAPPGAAVSLGLRLENRQQTTAPVMALPSPMQSADGNVWMPAAEARVILVPGRRTLADTVELGPAPADAGIYEGCVLLLGVDGGIVRVIVEVAS